MKCASFTIYEPKFENWNAERNFIFQIYGRKSVQFKRIASSITNTDECSKEKECRRTFARRTETGRRKRKERRTKFPSATRVTLLIILSHGAALMSRDLGVSKCTGWSDTRCSVRGFPLFSARFEQRWPAESRSKSDTACAIAARGREHTNDDRGIRFRRCRPGLSIYPGKVFVN